MARRLYILPLAAFLASCESALHRDPEASAPAPIPEASVPVAEVTGLEVARAPEEVVVTAWAEPKHLPPGGGIVQILVRAQKRGGAPYPGIEVRLKSSSGSLFSSQRVLTTDRGGMTRDRLTARRTAEITMNAGGTRYRIVVPVLPEFPE